MFPLVLRKKRRCPEKRRQMRGEKQRKETSLFTCIDRGDDRKILFLEVHIHKMNDFLELQDLIRLL